ncbi:MAG: hypothetical protein K8S97_09260 [Anaerolineae bacterium]|nr:hypothetical protein [Anaerolineae bacterium]
MTEPLNDLTIRLDMTQLVNLVQITVYPVETTGSLAVLWTARTVLRIAPGQTRVIYAPFRDDNGDRVAAVDVPNLVASTDYTVNDQSDGNGFDYTTSSHFDISMTVEATRAKITLQNTATGPLYVTTLQVRGKPIRTYDPITIEIEDTTSQTTYEKRTRSLDLTMQSDPVFAQAYGEYLIGRFAAPVLRAERVRIVGVAVLGTVNVFSLDLMDKVIINDPHTGADALAHWISAIEYDLQGSTFSVTLHLERAGERAYWLLGKEDYGELDTATRLGF